MRPGGDLAGRTRKDLDITTPIPESHASPTSFFLATEDMLGMVRRAPMDPASDSTFGVRSLQETVCEVGIGDSEREQQDADDDNDDDDDNEKEKMGENKGTGTRRRSTLKPKVPTRDSSPENLEQIKQTQSRDSPEVQPPDQLHSYPSVSHSVTSLSQASQAQGLSMPSSPKSTSTRSLRPSDEESMDDGRSHAILSSEDDEIEHSLEVQNTAPQLIMPSIKMPSRRPFTERGKDIGRLKILIAGDSGMTFFLFHEKC